MLQNDKHQTLEKGHAKEENMIAGHHLPQVVVLLSGLP